MERVVSWRLVNLLGVIAGMCCQVVAAHAAGVAGLDANDAATVKSCIVDLSSPEFATREAAQKRLETVPYAEIETLRKYGEAITDAEAKARIGAALDHIEDIALTTVPPISVDLKNATRREVAEALSKALHSHITSNTAAQPVEERFTLKAENLSLWEVLDRLNEQHPLWLFEPNWIGRGTVQHQLTRGVALYRQVMPATSSSFMLQVSVVADPRLKVLATQAITLDSARDAAGRDFMPRADRAADIANQRSPDAPPGARTTHFSYTISDPASTMGTFKGNVVFLIQAAEARAEIADAAKHTGDMIVLGDSSVTIRKINPADKDAKRAAVYLEIVPVDSKIAAPAAPPVTFPGGAVTYPADMTAPAGTLLTLDEEGSPGSITRGSAPAGLQPIQVTITDADGTGIADYKVPRGIPVTNIHGIPPDFKPPLTVTFAYPTRTREVTIPFEFKDVALNLRKDGP